MQEEQLDVELESDNDVEERTIELSCDYKNSMEENRVNNQEKIQDLLSIRMLANEEDD